MPEFRETFTLRAAGALTNTGNPKDRWESGYNGEITGLDGQVGTAPTGAAIVFDIVKNNVSLINNVVLANVTSNWTAQNTTGGVGATDTTITVTPATYNQNYTDVAGTVHTQPVQREIGNGTTIVIDTEQLVVTNVAGSPSSGSSGQGNNYVLTVNRGVNGTAAAAHAQNAPVYYAPPTILAGQTQLSTSYDNVDLGRFAPDDVIALNVTQVGSTVAGSDLGVNVEFVAE